MENTKEQIERFNEFIEGLKNEIEYERKFNPNDCDKISWSNQDGILISVNEAELLVNMYDKLIRV